MTDTKSIADRMAEAAEMDLALPYSLMQDALDRMRFGGMEPLIRTLFERDLTEALDAYEADQNAYWTDERIARARGDEPDPEAERIAGIVRYFDEASTT